MVFQSYALYPHMTVFDNMAFGMKLSGRSKDECRKRVEQAAGMLQLSSYLERLPRQLSGGQRQRVAIGRAIVRDPKVFLFDEPLSNLDAALRVATRLEIAKLHRSMHNTTMIYVTHDQSEAMALATDVAVMSEGRLLQVAPPAEIYARPEGRMVGGLIGRGAIVTLPVMGGERQLEWDELEGALHAANIDGADILVRPEDVIIGGEGAPAMVESVLFEGERYAVKLMLCNGQALRAYSRVAVVPDEAVRVIIRAGWRL